MNTFGLTSAMVMLFRIRIRVKSFAKLSMRTNGWASSNSMTVKSVMDILTRMEFLSVELGAWAKTTQNLCSSMSTTMSQLLDVALASLGQ